MDKPPIADLIWRFVKDRIPNTAMSAEVVELDKPNKKVKVKLYSADVEFTDVYLCGVETDAIEASVIYPKVGSTVLVAIRNNVPNDLFVVAVTEVEEQELHGNAFGGLVKVEELVDRLNLIEQKVNEVINTFNLHIHPTPSGPSSPTGTLIPGTLLQTQRSQIENEKVTHG